MMHGMNALRKVLAALLLLGLVFSLCGCSGGKTVTKTNGDGTETKIVFENHGILTRAPRFSKDGDTVTMEFNGRCWYTARPSDAEEAERLAANPLLAESTNIRVYQNDADDGFDYLYLLKLEGSEEAFILLESVDPPDMPGYGADFNNGIEYWVDGTATAADTEWELTDAFADNGDGE